MTNWIRSSRTRKPPRDATFLAAAAAAGAAADLLNGHAVAEEAKVARSLKYAVV